MVELKLLTIQYDPIKISSLHIKDCVLYLISNVKQIPRCRQKKKWISKVLFILANIRSFPVKILNKPSWEYTNNLVQFPREHFVTAKVVYRILLCLHVCSFSQWVKYLRFKFWLQIGIIYLWTCRHKSKNGTGLKETRFPLRLYLEGFFPPLLQLLEK